MTPLHLIGIGMAALVAVISLHTSHSVEGLSFATALATGLLGHAQGARGQQRRADDPPEAKP